MSRMPGYFKHLEVIENELAGFPPTAAFTFAVACAERQWPIYERASQGKKWARREVLRSALDAIWDWLLRKRRRPSEFSEPCLEAVFDENDPDPSTGCALDAANQIYGTVAIVEHDESHAASYAGKNNLDQVIAFLYEVFRLRYSPKNDRTVERHELTRREMKHQRNDIKLLSDKLSVSTVVKVRTLSQGHNLFGNLWWS